MTQQKKFDYKIKQDANTWSAEITRRVSARRSSVSKQQDGFATEALAIEWATAELAGFLEKQKQANARKSERRSERNAQAEKAAAAKEAANEKFLAKREEARARALEADDEELDYDYDEE
ncbi:MULTISPECIES: DUF3622 domain-containing protein [Psychromonas]|uniref:DUF3622 domain-containing protein n=1 Tax=Psychromonas TaxID=67572 RepID=UPI0004225F07|nr:MULTISPECIES: DUF3622 domain-containing protein [Psychromonas]MBB1274745.1 DUF3622 domain-containing protein [Psychromonas sp. SR45-3]